MPDFTCCSNGSSALCVNAVCIVGEADIRVDVVILAGKGLGVTVAMEVKQINKDSTFQILRRLMPSILLELMRRTSEVRKAIFTVMIFAALTS